MDRRRFLMASAGAASLAGLGGLLPPKAALGALGDIDRPKTLDRHQWRTLDVVSAHLLPSEPDSPGAREANVVAYLDAAMAYPGFDTDIKAFLLDGVGWLDGIARTDTGKDAADLAPAALEPVLRKVAASSAGENWIATLLLFVFEAVLSDPAYGGNPDGVGWAWLDHTPGEPRPPAARIYGRPGGTVWHGKG